MAVLGACGLFSVAGATSVLSAPAATAVPSPTPDAVCIGGIPDLSTNGAGPADCGCLGSAALAGRPAGVPIGTGCSFPVNLCPSGELTCGGASSSTSGGSATATDGCLTASGLLGEGGLTVGPYGSDPDAALSMGSEFFDVSLSPGSTFLDVTITVDLDECGGTPGSTLDWWNGSAWVPVMGDPGPTYDEGPPPMLMVTLNGSSTSPTVGQLSGSPFAIVVVPSFTAPLAGTATPNPNGTTSYVVPTVP